ncbi:MAG: UbiD family decarboxylase [Thermosediminibacteraceae bacterium]|nr:UbiD family decarboxylase [Thermosediminibacteraceae bacterium]
MYKDLQDFVNVLEQKGQLKRIKVEVDSELEVTEIVDRVVKQGGPALLFENVKGSKFPLLVNTFGTYERMKLALEVESLDDIAKEIEELMDISNYIGLFNQIRSATKLANLQKYSQKKLSKGHVKKLLKNRTFPNCRF